MTHPTCHKAKCVTHYGVTLLKSKTPAVLQYLREEQSPVVFPAAVLTQDVRLFVHQPLLIVDSSLLLIAQHRIQLSQHLEGGGEIHVRFNFTHTSAALTKKYFMYFRD